MSFHISQTPTLEAVSTDDDARLAQDLHTRVAEAVVHAESLPGTMIAAESARTAAAHFERLRTAERALHRWAKEARTKLDEISGAALEAWWSRQPKARRQTGRRPTKPRLSRIRFGKAGAL
ncbi:MAG: hypothetical protein WDO18_01315 [Acidobacteriota bacterium]